VLPGFERRQDRMQAEFSQGNNKGPYSARIAFEGAPDAVVILQLVNKQR